MRPPVAEPLHSNSWVRPAGNGDFRVTQDFDAVDPVYPTVKHRALDIGDGDADRDWIVAPDSGVILAEGWLREPWSQSSTAYGTGNFGGIMVVILGDDGYVSAVAHLSDSIVNAGQRVLKGQALGHIGDTGAAKGRGAHVHWDVYRAIPKTWAEREAYKVDPWPLLDQNAGLPDTSTTPGAPDMRYSGSEVAFSDDFPVHRLNANSNFREAPTTASASLKVFPAGTAVGAFPFTVKGQALSMGDRWQPALMYVDTAYVSGFFHTSVVERVDVEDGLAAALDSANKRAASIKSTAIASLKNLAVTAESKADAIAKL